MLGGYFLYVQGDDMPFFISYILEMTACYRLLHHYILCSILESMTQSHQFIFGNKQSLIDQRLDSKGIVVPF